jgi:CHAT domain-containing protein
LTRPFDKHLDSDELDRLVSLPDTSASGSEQLSEPVLREAQRHVESCHDCSRKLQRHQFVHREILRMRVPDPSPSTPECMGDAEWLEVAAGLLPEAKTRERMKHAAQCGHCGPLVRNAAEALMDEATPSEEALLASLQSARPEWRKNLAATLHDSVRDRQAKSPWWKAIFVWPAPAYAFAGIIAVAAAAWIGMWALRPPSAEQLLAQAYTERRTIEVRIPGAKYAPMRVERSGTGSNFDKPEPLLKAEALIGEKLKQYPNDPKWLEARARAELLDGSYDDAIKTLQQALESDPDSPSLLTDLGSAYFLRAKSADRPIDYGNAIESLGKTLAKRPDDPIALFNRALACEGVFLFTQATEDWEHYLRIDPQGEWSDEARRRLQKLKERLNQHNQGMATPLLRPNQIAEASANGTDLTDQINERIEEYLVVATTEWLPKAYPVRRSLSADNDSRSALHFLALVLSEKHGDTWLEDLLSGSPSPAFPQAIEHLALAIQADEAGNNVIGLKHSIEAERLFRTIGNSAGITRAEVESIFAAHDAQDGVSCLQAVDRTKLIARSYRWLTIEFHIEQGTCRGFVGDLGAMRHLYQQAADEAQAARFSVIYLRTQDHLSHLDSEDGSLSAGWVRTQKALALYWVEQYPPMRGYNLYLNLYEFAGVRAQPHLQMATWRDGVALSESLPDNVIRAMANSLMGSAAVAAGEAGIAERAFSRSSTLFSKAPQIKSNLIAQIEAETRLAEVETLEGRPKDAVERLRRYASEVAQLSDNFLGILYESALGRAEASAGNYPEAESALRSAIGISELNLKFIHGDRARFEWAQRTRDAYSYFAELQLRRGDSQDALETWEWYRAAALREGKSRASSASIEPAEPVAPQTVAEALPTLTRITYISYAVLPRGLAIWVYDNRGVFSYWVERNPAEISEKIAHFRALCADSRSDLSNVQQSARLLYQTLVAPIEPRLAADRILLIELDDGISGLPFDALLDSQNRYLGDRYTAISSLGISYQSSVGDGAIGLDAPALVVAVPTSHAVTGSTTPPLADALAEGQMVARTFNNAHLLLGNNASVSEVLADLPTAQVFHFAGHAISSPVQSGLLLSDNLLNAESLRDVPLPRMQLAVFSACDTEDSANGGTGNADSLVRVFLRAGAARVVATRWNVDSGVTHDFMNLFYRGLVSGKTVSGSMHYAQSVLRSQPGLVHPYYWSAFTAFGAI